MALISLEDLEGLDDDITDDITDDVTDDVTTGGGDNPEPMGGEHDEQLLNHWRAVARTHQVTVPTEMAGPIQEMTRNNQRENRETVPSTTLSRHDKMGEVWEEREYPAGFWACVSDCEKLYEQSVSNSFMKLMRYICKDNASGRYLGMTVPVISLVRVSADGESFEKKVETCFYLPRCFQEAPPTPADRDITIVLRQPIRIIARTFFGTTNEQTVSAQIRQLWEVLGYRDDVLRSDYIIAAYENPAVPRRRNEVWFIRRE